MWNLARWLAMGLALCCPSLCRAQQPPEALAIQELTRRLDAQEAEIRALHQRLQGERPQRESSAAAAAGKSCDQPLKRLPVVAEYCPQSKCGESSKTPDSQTLRYFTDYDSGFVIRPFCPERRPFELKINGWIQFRHHNFWRDVTSWTDNAGVTRPVDNRSAFDIERGRLILSGFALDERLTYFLHLDGDTDGGHVVDFFDYWWAWEFYENHRVQFGKRKVPAGRQWLLTARHTRFVERPMANDFFRPDRTVGVFGIGEIGENGHYEWMVGNGYQTSELPNSSTDDRFTLALTNYFDPLGNYGPQIVDYDGTSQPLVRIGHSFVYSPNRGLAPGVPLPETSFIRLTDGTRLTQTGALAPGVTVSDFQIYFYGVDAALKWRGWSVNAEVFWRWIEQLRGNGPLPVDDLLQQGYYVEGGRFVIPRKLDFNLRYSRVNGLFGDATEYALGGNWYPLDTHRLKISCDLTTLDGSPLQNTASDILVGDDGYLLRTQFQAEY